jgi:hypothetical protein
LIPIISLGAINPDTIISKGQVSPFDGVLLDPQVYKDNSIKVLEWNDFTKNEQAYLKPSPVEVPIAIKTGDYILLISLSAIGGAILYHCVADHCL